MSKQNTRATIDANIKQNGQQLITGQILNSVLNTMVTDYAEQAETTEKLTDLERSINDIEEVLFGSKNYTEGALLNSDGGTTPNDNWGYSDFIPYEQGKSIRWQAGGLQSAMLDACILFYDGNKNYISGAYWRYNSTPKTISASEINLYASNASYIRISLRLDFSVLPNVQYDDIEVWTAGDTESILAPIVEEQERLEGQINGKSAELHYTGSVSNAYKSIPMHIESGKSFRIDYTFSQIQGAVGGGWIEAYTRQTSGGSNVQTLGVLPDNTFTFVATANAEYLYLALVNCAVCDLTIKEVGGIANDVATLKSQVADKVDKVTGKGLSTNDYTDEDKYLVSTLKTTTEKETSLTGQLVFGSYDLTGSVIPEMSSTTSAKCLKVSCKSGDVFTITGRGGTNIRLYGFADTDGRLLSVGEANIERTNAELVAGQDGYFVANFFTAFPYSLKVKTTEVSYITDDVKEVVSVPVVNLPSKLIAVKGREYNIYKDNILVDCSTDDLCLVDSNIVNSESATNYETKRRVRWTPTSAGTSAKKFDFYVNRLSKLNATKDVSCVVVDDATMNGRNIKFMCIGDSKTNGGWQPSVIRENLISKGATATSLGTIANTISPSCPMEGRSGWAAYHYTHNQSYGSFTNAFWNPSTSKFDFSYYMAQQGYSGVDVVFICLGTNDEGLGYGDTLCDNIEEMIASIHSYNTNVKVIIGITEPCYEGEIGTFFWRANNIKKLDTLLINAFDKRESEKIYITPIHLSYDTREDFIKTEVSLSYADTYRDTGKKEMIVADGLNQLHQNSVGYVKNAECMYATMVYVLNL